MEVFLLMVLFAMTIVLACLVRVYLATCAELADTKRERDRLRYLQENPLGKDAA